MNKNQTAKSKRGGNLVWRTMDLHLHTPASSDYQEPKVTYLDILQTAEKRGLDIIAFTDHNTVAGLRRLRDEIAELELLERLQRLVPEEGYRLSEYRRLLGKLLLLPGFEFTATFGFHVMGIFPPEVPVRDLEHLLLSMNVPRDQLDLGAVAVGATTDVLTAYRLIGEAGGLAIAAHANSTNGVAMRGFGFGGQTKIAFTQDPDLCALEVTDLDQKGKRSTSAFFSGTKPEYPRRMHCITGSDAHRLTRDPQNSKNLGVGERATDLLLDEVGFDALRALFQGSDFARIRPHVPGTTQAEFDHVQQARDEGPNLLQAFHESMQARGGRLYNVIADVCALANTNGGTVFVGVSADPKQAPIGVPEPEQAIRELRSALARMLTPQIECTIDAQTSQGKQIIRLLVPRGDDPPYAIEDNKIYVREEAETSLAVRDEIVRLVQRRHTGIPAALTPAPAPRAGAGQPAPAALVQPANVAALPSGPSLLQTPVGPPRTGVEIVASEDRDGQRYHTMRDLRNGSVVKNVTRSSARKLWHYAITAKEAGALSPHMVNWQGDIGLWRKTHKGGQTRYDLVQRADSQTHVYYGVTEDGIHGPWRKLIETEERPPAGSLQVPAVIPSGLADRPAEVDEAFVRETGEARDLGAGLATASSETGRFEATSPYAVRADAEMPEDISDETIAPALSEPATNGAAARGRRARTGASKKATRPRPGAAKATKTAGRGAAKSPARVRVKRPKPEIGQAS